MAKATPLFGSSKRADLDLDVEYGSTVLHLDMSDALNMMLYAAKHPDGTPGYTSWQLFSPLDSIVLREFLVQEGVFDGAGDIIHSHQVYITHDMLDRLHRVHGVQPYEIHQHGGEVVYIPAGCTHQVQLAGLHQYLALLETMSSFNIAIITKPCTH